MMQRITTAWLWRGVRLAAAGLAILTLAQISGQTVQAKEFDVTGTIDCGARSGKKCDFTDWSTGPVIGVLTEDISGTRQLAMIDASWVKHDLDNFDQDDFVWFTVEDNGGPNLQATGVLEHRCNDGTADLGTINQGKSTGHHCRR
jgi:hypothetical protein